MAVPNSPPMPDIAALTFGNQQPAQPQNPPNPPNPVPNSAPQLSQDWKTPARQIPQGEPYEYTKWLGSESRWKDRVGKGWVANKVLGQGGYGIVGHWEYKGPDRDSKPLKDVVVKQATTWRLGGRKSEGLDEEADFLQTFLTSRTQHIVRIYRRIYKDIGAGTVKPDPTHEVHRIFLEFCPGGDLANFFNKKKRDAQLPLSEIELWMIFHCLARALLVIHSGSENSGKNQPRWSRKEICHFDLKPQNSNSS